MGPRVRSFVGRNDSATPAPDGRLPAATQDVEELLELFEAKTIDRGDLITLLGAHSVGQQRFEDPARSGDPHDTTPGVWDAIPFYEQTVSNNSAAAKLSFTPSADNITLWIDTSARAALGLVADIVCTTKPHRNHPSLVTIASNHHRSP